jgi:DNA-binding IclR family transcriptional regulator
MVDADVPPSILSQAIDQLRAFNANERVMTLTDLSKASGLPKSTVHRLLARLIELGAIEHHRTGYKIGIELFRLGASIPAAGLRDAAMPHLAALHRWTGQTVHLAAVLRQFDVVFLERLAVHGEPSALSGAGSRLPANCTAVGKALLAYENPDDLEFFLPDPMPRMTMSSLTDVAALLAQLREIRQGALARECEEARLGVACVALPLVVNGFAVGAVSAAHPAGAPPDKKMDTVLRETTVRITREVQAHLAEGRSHWFPREI